MIRGSHLHRRAWNTLWPVEKRWCREYYNFGMEFLLKLDLNGTRRFFDAFFELNPHLWQGFLSARLSYGELITLGISLFGRASNPSRLELLTKCPAPLVQMVGNMALETI
ncbi:UNVERIFIED_CONTAM: Capsanthin/capsorubin synthase, chromoplastic [Sesamum latifolium]|uniref:Capsanthin/capsorubin synthase, chromoplastic n=1 Tax=Sesamum latifolium TaxID=2727402 RepID=A0AAW2Y2R3_9LAMI